MNRLQLGKLEDDLKQDPIMRRAMSDMTMYLTEQNLSPQDALNSAVQQNPELSPDSRLKLNQLVQARQSIANQGDVLRLRDLATQIDQINANTNAMNAQTNAQIAAANQRKSAEAEKRRGKGVTTYDIPGSDSMVVEFPSGEGTRSQVVDAADGGQDDVNSLSLEGRKVTTQVNEILGHIENVEEGDDRYGLGNIFSRQNQSMDLVKTIAKNNRTYKAKYGSNHPDYLRLMQRVAPFIEKNKNSTDATNKKLAKRLATELGIQID